MAYEFNMNLPQGSGNAPQEPEKTVLFGTDIRNSEPFRSVVHSGQHHIAFQSPYGDVFGMSEEMLSKHLLLLGGIGCGKTNVFNFILESLLHRIGSNDILIIFDTKGDFKQLFYDPNNPRHILIGNDTAYQRISKSWNIFDELRDRNGQFTKESELTAKEVANELFKGRESDSQPFFALAAADLVAKAMIHLIRDAKRRHTEANLHTEDLVSFLKGANFQTYYDMTKSPDNPDFASAQLYIGSPTGNMTAQALGVFGYINAMVNDLFIGIFAERRLSGSYSMRQLVREKGKRVVFVEYDLSVGETLGPMYRLMFDLALKEALGARTQNRGNTYLLIDEFKLLPDLSHIDDALNFGRSLGVKVIAGLQSINQLYDIYEEDRGKVLAAGFMNSFCFQTMDVDSRKYISDRFGETYIDLAFRSSTRDISVQRDGHVVEDWDILNLDVGEAFVNLFGQKPFKFRFGDFRNPHAVL